MKKSVSAILAIVTLFICIFAFAACNKDEGTPATTAAPTSTTKLYSIPAELDGKTPEQVTANQEFTLYVTQAGETPTNSEGNPEAKPLIETNGNVEIVYDSFNYSHNSSASLKGFEIEDDGFRHTAIGFATVEILSFDNTESEMRIAYKAYDANGEICRNSHIRIDLANAKVGDVVECRFEVPRDAVKVVFENFTDY